MMQYPTFLEHLRSRYGSNWCVAARASGRTAQYDCVITPKQYDAEETEWSLGHPAYLAVVENIPADHPHRELILNAVLLQVRVS